MKRTPKSRRARLFPWPLALLALMAGSCATEPDPLDRTQPEAVPKAIFNGEWYYLLTVTDADWDNKLTFIGEQSNTYQGKPVKVRWEIAQDKLNAFMVPQVYRDESGKVVENQAGQKSLVLSFKIKKHYDIRYRYNSTTREELNVLEENTDRPWNEREYMEIDWSESTATNIWAPTAMEVETGSMQRDNVAVYENVEFFARGATPDQDQLINTRQWDPKEDPEVHAINIDTKESISSKLRAWWQLYYGYYMEPTTVRFRHSLLKAKPLDQQTYKPLDYPDEMFRRFGYFRTEYNVYDPDRHTTTQSEKKYYANRWDLSGNKQINWYMSPAFQEAVDKGDTAIKTWIQQICDAYNKVFQEATGRTDRIVVLHENKPLLDAEGKQLERDDGTKRWAYELGDLRFPMINLTFKQSGSQPLGYGPSMPDPDTGEIIHATVHVYAGWAEWVVQRAMDQYDVAAGNCTLEDIKNGRYFDDKTGKCDAGDQSPPLDGPVNGSGTTTVGPNGTKIYGGQRLPVMTPALKTAYWPKADIRAAMPANMTQQLAVAQPKLKAMYDWERKHTTQMDLRGFATIAGTPYEAQLVPQNNQHSLAPYAQGPTDPDFINEMSPATRLDPKRMDALRKQMIQEMSVRDEPTMFEPAIHAFVQEMKGKPRSEVEKELRHWIFYNTTIHEMGHTLGLRHNFAGSADRRNFTPEFEPAHKTYWDKVDALRKTYAAKIKAGDPVAYEEYVQKVDEIPSTHNRFGSASVMDYTGDWIDWTEPVRPYDRAALHLAYGNKVEVWSDKRAAWEPQTFKAGDFDVDDPLNSTTLPKSGRKVRYYMFCSDEKTFDDAFCTPFDRGTTATEIVRNFIRDSQINYLFSNFKRDRTGFDNWRGSYYSYKWFRQYYMYAKPFAQMTLNSIRYDEFWSSIFDGINRMVQGPESRDMKPGYYHDGGEDLLRASLLFYYHLLFDVLMRPDYGNYQMKYDTSGAAYWESTKAKYVDATKPTVFVPVGVGWGFNDYWDVQSDPQRYDVQLRRIGVELDKVVALEVLSIPMVFNDPLGYEKANGNSFWSSLWTANGVQLWDVVRGMVTDNFSHLQNPWCIKCDAACQADPKKNPPALRAYPIDYLEGLGRAGIFSKYPLPTGKNRCGPDEQPVQPGMDALFAIKPIFYAISGASHPWYHNALTDKLDSQVKGGLHRFEIPAGAQVAEFLNSSGTKIYQAVQTDDTMSISYTLVKNASEIRNRLDLAVACIDGTDTTGLVGKPGTHNRTCADINMCYSNNAAAWCEPEGWSSSFSLPSVRYADLDRIEAMLIMMQDMIDIAGHYSWRVPGYLSE